MWVCIVLLKEGILIWTIVIEFCLLNSKIKFTVA